MSGDRKKTTKIKGTDTRMLVPVYIAAFIILSDASYLNISRNPFFYNLQDITGILHFEWVIYSDILLFLLVAAAVLWKREKSITFVRVIYGIQSIIMTGVFFLVLYANSIINQMTGRPDTFMNLTIYSTIQMPSVLYAQLILSLAMVFLAEGLLDINKERRPAKYKKQVKTGPRTKVALVIMLVLIPAVIFFGIFFLNDRSNIFIGLCIITLAMVPFLTIFEDMRPDARILLVIAVMSTLAVVGRMAFFMVPQFKPVAAIVIIAGIGLGPEAGFLTGAVSAFVSNFFYGQGPWTPWQMFAFGIIGFLGGVLFHKKKAVQKRKILLCIYGGAATLIIYGLIMDTASVLNFSRGFSWEILLASYISGFPFNVIHAVSTVIFLFVLAGPIEKKLDRIQKKFMLF